jgi:hypothetical protein
MRNGKQEKPLRGGKGLIKLSYFISNIVAQRDQQISGPPKSRVRIRSKEVCK